jgi:dTMP kinase
MRAADELKAALAAGDIVVCDRYIFSNIAYQCAKVADPRGQADLADWIERLEYGSHAIPRPDLTLYLDVPPEFIRANLQAAREGGDRDYLKGGRDIHEASDMLQARVRDQFLHLAQTRVAEIGLVDCRGDDGIIADRQTIHSRILDALRYYRIITR